MGVLVQAVVLIWGSGCWLLESRQVVGIWLLGLKNPFD